MKFTPYKNRIHIILHMYDGNFLARGKNPDTVHRPSVIRKIANLNNIVTQPLRGDS